MKNGHSFLNEHIFQNYLIHFWENVSTPVGRKLDIEYLLSICLAKGETFATFASSGNFPLNMLLLIPLDNGVLKIFAEN